MINKYNYACKLILLLVSINVFNYSTKMADNFEAELSWCLEKLQLNLEECKNERKSQQIHNTIKTLSNTKAPLVKKRQLMRIHLGDYRQKMSEEEKQFKLDAKMQKAKISRGSKSIVVKKKSDVNNKPGAKSDGESTFKFNFQPNNESKPENEPDEKLPQLNSVASNTKETSDSALHHKFKYIPSDNSFRFNFSAE